MAKFYAVEITLTTIVQIGDDQDEFDAERAAEDESWEILNDARCTDGIEYRCVGEVRSVADLAQHGWDEMCLPYCGDGDTRLKDLLPAAGEPASGQPA